MYFDQRTGAPLLKKEKSVLKCIKANQNAGRPPFRTYFSDIKCTFKYKITQKIKINHAKSCLSIKKLILTSERFAEHPFAGRNTQQKCMVTRFYEKSSKGKKVTLDTLAVSRPVFHK